MTLQTSIEKIPRIGPSFQKKLKKMGIKTAQDLLFHFPHRYEDFSNIKPIEKVALNKKNCILGKILEIQNIKTPKKKMTLTEAIVEDKTAAIKVVWFGQPYLTNVLKKGDFVSLAGKVVLKNRTLYLSNPVFEKVSFSTQGEIHLLHTGRIVPIYPETEGLSSRWLRSIIKFLLEKLKDKIPEILPQDILKNNNLMNRVEALQEIHFPRSLAAAKKAQRRFAFEELFLIELAVLQERMRLNREKAPAIPIQIDLIKKFVSSLPFTLTDAQRKCAWQILNDMAHTQPMSRLLQGDVGSGKTVVAVIAALNAVKAGYQVAFMAPTEILAHQHFKEVSNLLQDFKVKIALLTSKSDKIISQKLKNEVVEISRSKLLEKTREGEIDILIGTHTLIQEKVSFKKLGFCVVDEQHRFGVEQRAKLVKPSRDHQKLNFSVPHFLSMTATPIPRSLALTIYGNLDLSILDEMPKGRKKVITKIVPPKEREKTYQFVRERVSLGEQVFVVCPRIEKRGTKNPALSEVKAVEEEYERLSKEIFPDLKVAMLHGKMPSREKEEIMQKFKNKKIDILVSTSVIEVGIDIPGATVMIIEGAERFGLAQLHQFRGRVGRSGLQSYCFLFTESNSIKAKKRLQALKEAKSGFELAEKDLQIRGPGSLLGTRQWGVPDLAMESLKNLPLVEKTRQSALELLRKDPLLKCCPLLKQKVDSMGAKVFFE